MGCGSSRDDKRQENADKAALVSGLFVLLNSAKEVKVDAASVKAVATELLALVAELTANKDEKPSIFGQWKATDALAETNKVIEALAAATESADFKPVAAVKTDVVAEGGEKAIAEIGGALLV